MRFAADENFNGKLLAGLRKRLPDVDIVRVQDTPMYQASDPELLEWTAQQGRVLLTHDAKTIPGFFYDRVRDGLPAPGVVEIQEGIPMGQILDELEVLMGAGTPEDFENVVHYVPMK